MAFFFKTKQFIELGFGFFFFFINFTDRNKKQTEGVILFPQLLCKKNCGETYVISVPTSTMCNSL